jgi:hypothetical protein
MIYSWKAKYNNFKIENTKRNEHEILDESNKIFIFIVGN